MSATNKTDKRFFPSSEWSGEKFASWFTNNQTRGQYSSYNTARVNHSRTPASETDRHTGLFPAGNEMRNNRQQSKSRSEDFQMQQHGFSQHDSNLSFNTC